MPEANFIGLVSARIMRRPEARAGVNEAKTAMVLRWELPTNYSVTAAVGGGPGRLR